MYTRCKIQDEITRSTHESMYVLHGLNFKTKTFKFLTDDVRVTPSKFSFYQDLNFYFPSVSEGSIVKKVAVKLH